MVVRAQSAPVLTQDELKKQAASKAVEYVSSGMVLGLGTGSTAAFVVAEIGELLASGKLGDIVGVPTSKRTYEQALSLGIPLSTLDDHPHIDLAIDGADEVIPDPLRSPLDRPTDQAAPEHPMIRFLPCSASGWRRWTPSSTW